jgi:hypothetical protein
MKVWIKTLYANIEIKQYGLELQVRSPDDDVQLGDFYVTMKELIWCRGKIPRGNGVRVLWQDFMEICWSKDTLKAALKAAKAEKALKVTKTVI